MLFNFGMPFFKSDYVNFLGRLLLNSYLFVFLNLYNITHEWGFLSFRGLLVKGQIFFTFPIFGRRFDITFREYCIFEKKNPSQNITTSMRIQHSHGKRIFPIMKRSKYPYHHPKPPATDHCSLPLATLCRRRRCRQLATTGHPPPSVDHQPLSPSMVFLEIY